MRAAGRLVKEGGAEAVKLEGGAEIAALVRRLVARRHPGDGARRAHAAVGARSSAASRCRGATTSSATQILADARAARGGGRVRDRARGRSPAVAADDDRAVLACPTIGIGAGADCDGQVLVMHDLLGLDDVVVKPRFVRRYDELAVRRRRDVRADEFDRRLCDGHASSARQRPPVAAARCAARFQTRAQGSGSRARRSPRELIRARPVADHPHAGRDDRVVARGQRARRTCRVRPDDGRAARRPRRAAARGAAARRPAGAVDLRQPDAVRPQRGSVALPARPAPAIWPRRRRRAPTSRSCPRRPTCTRPGTRRSSRCASWRPACAARAGPGTSPASPRW